MATKILVGVTALALAFIVFALIAQPKSCTGNLLADDMSCNIIGEQK